MKAVLSPLKPRLHCLPGPRGINHYWKSTCLKLICVIYLFKGHSKTWEVTVKTKGSRKNIRYWPTCEYRTCSSWPWTNIRWLHWLLWFTLVAVWARSVRVKGTNSVNYISWRQKKFSIFSERRFQSWALFHSTVQIEDFMIDLPNSSIGNVGECVGLICFWQKMSFWAFHGPTSFHKNPISIALKKSSSLC